MLDEIISNQRRLEMAALGRRGNHLDEVREFSAKVGVEYAEAIAIEARKLDWREVVMAVCDGLKASGRLSQTFALEMNYSHETDT